jgi:hypothetical protein
LTTSFIFHNKIFSNKSADLRKGGFFMNKKLLLSGILVCLLIFSFGLVGCGDGAGGGGDDASLPANLKNTTWGSHASVSGKLVFTENTIEGFYSSSPQVVVSATENGKITFKYSVEKDSDAETFCENYSIAATTLTITGGKYAGAWTKEE